MARKDSKSPDNAARLHVHSNIATINFPSHMLRLQQRDACDRQQQKNLSDLSAGGGLSVLPPPTHTSTTICTSIHTAAAPQQLLLP